MVLPVPVTSPELEANLTLPSPVRPINPPTELSPLTLPEMIALLFHNLFTLPRCGNHDSAILYDETRKQSVR